MQMQSTPLSFELELAPGEKLSLPPAIVEGVGPGHWIVTITPVSDESEKVRGHTAFLSSYAKEDEGLYDDFATR